MTDEGIVSCSVQSTAGITWPLLFYLTNHSSPVHILFEARDRFTLLVPANVDVQYSETTPLEFHDCTGGDVRGYFIS